MTPATITLCADCGSPAPASSAGWLRCPTCDTVYCPACPSAHRIVEHGECDSTQACTVCGATCLVEL
jgi:hypothetical protein